MVIAYQLRNMIAITDRMPPFELTYSVATLVYAIPLDRPKYLSCLLNCTLWHHLRYTCTKYLISIYIQISTIRKKDHYYVPNSAKVLVIDNSTTLCLIMSRALEKAGYQVITASNGNEGLAKALQVRPHCVIIDVVLPGISGFGLCRQLRALDPQRNLSIIMVSTKNTSLDHSWGLRQGADRYLPKPFSDEALVQSVEEVLREHALR
jgi:CheY-like chemotaxis protein